MILCVPLCVLLSAVYGLINDDDADELLCGRFGVAIERGGRRD